MLQISVLLMDGVWGSQLMGITDFLTIFNIIATKKSDAKTIQWTLYGVDQTSIRLANGLSLPVHPLPSSPLPHNVLVLLGVEYAQLQPYLAQGDAHWQRLYQYFQASEMMVSVSTGVFVWAQTGLLAGHTVVTHPRFETHFARRYPQVLLRRGVECVLSDQHCHAATLTGALYGIARAILRWDQHLITQQCLALALHQTDAIAQGWLLDTWLYKQHQDMRIQALQQQIDQHYAQPFVLAELAACYAWSETTLKRRFKTATGLSIGQYYQVVRMARMKHLLIQRELSVEQICSQIGYADPRFARRLFVQATGYCPRQYRSM